MSPILTRLFLLFKSLLTSKTTWFNIVFGAVQCQMLLLKRSIFFTTKFAPNFQTGKYFTACVHTALNWQWKQVVKLINLTYLCNELFIQRIVNPQVNIPSPQSLFLSGWDIGYCSLVHLAHGIWIRFTFHQAKVVEPRVIIVRVRLHFLRVKFSTVVRNEENKFPDFSQFLLPIILRCSNERQPKLSYTKLFSLTRWFFSQKQFHEFSIDRKLRNSSAIY